MRVAIMSDLHGFSLALDTVTSEIDRTGPYDAVVAAGDLCAVGPDPKGVLERLRARPSWIVLKGNTDDDIVAYAARDDRTWPVSALDGDDVAWLDALPLAHRFPAPDLPDDDHSLLVVHANPWGLHVRLDPRKDDATVSEVLGGARFETIAFGHVHISDIRRIGRQQLVDVSAVGNPKDGELTGRFGVLTWDADQQGWSAEIRRLPYPLDATIRQAHASAIPDPDGMLRTLQRARYGS